MEVLRTELPHVKWADATCLLEELRAVKTQEELSYIKRASETIVDSMLAAFASTRPSMTELEVVERLR